MAKRTIIDLFEGTVAQYGDKEFLVEKHGSKWDSTTYNEAKCEVLRIGAGLVALGIEPKQTISILSEGCNNWILSEL